MCAVNRPFLSFSALALATASAFACTTTANVGDLTTTASDAEAGPLPTDGGVAEAAPSDAPVSDAPIDAGPVVDAGCGVKLSQEASFIDIQVQNGGPSWAGGGSIVPGTYALTGMKVYYTGTTGTARVRETMLVRGSPTIGTLDVLTETESATGSFKNATLHGESTDYNAPGDAFFFTPKCPKSDFEMTGRHLAQGTTLILYDASNGIERTYLRLR
jgi:hypothetical protein